MASNKDLNKANKAKKDEFYTMLADIEVELKHYRKHFKGKTVLCNCDDPFESNFFKYFAMNFNYLGLKKLIATCYQGSPILGEEFVQLSMFELDGETPKRHPYKIEIAEVIDANGDGTVDANDAFAANNKSANHDVASYTDAMAFVRSDINGSGTITAYDALMIARIAAGVQGVVVNFVAGK